jgi:hypothetical protein
MPRKGTWARSYRRAIIVYLLAIVGPALVLLLLSVQSVQRQREAITTLTSQNLKLLAERLSVEIEREVARLAESCLSDLPIQLLNVVPDRPPGAGYRQ